MLTADQGHAVLDQLHAALTTAQQKAESTKAAGESGIIAGALRLFGMDHTSQLDAQVGAVDIIGSAIARLEQDLPAAIDDPAMGDRWVDAAKSAATSLASVQAGVDEATIEDTLSKTAVESGTQIKQGANIVAGDTLRFVWSALPWWLIVGGLLVAGGVGYLQVRRVA